MIKAVHNTGSPPDGGEAVPGGGNSADIPGEAASPAALDDKAQALIGARLKELYGTLLNEGVPDHLLELIAELQRKERAS